jgi:divalent metal cation (Fe/Co/Zn/Cd) transporter
MFTFGAGVTLFEGIRHVADPHPISDPAVSYAVIAVSFVCEAITWAVAVREFRKLKGDEGYLSAIHSSKDPPHFMVLLEDSAALVGLAIAAAATFAAQAFDMPQIDGYGSIGIAVVLAVVAFVAARESKGLLIGEPASRTVRDSIVAIARSKPGVERADLVFNVHLGPDEIVIALSLEFSDSLSTTEIENRVTEIENEIQAKHKDVIAVFVKPQTATRFKDYRRHVREAVTHTAE